MNGAKAALAVVDEAARNLLAYRLVQREHHLAFGGNTFFRPAVRVAHGSSIGGTTGIFRKHRFAGRIPFHITSTFDSAYGARCRANRPRAVDVRWSSPGCLKWCAFQCGRD